MGRIVAICTSQKKGTAKKAVDYANIVENHGIEGDAHAGNWHRQVSLLSWQAIEAFKARGALVANGCFGENLVVDGIDFAALPVGTRIACNDVLLEVSQIGKECHKGCAIRDQVGDCIMPREGIFGRVLHGGWVRTGDELELVAPGEKIPLDAAVITASDKGSRGERVDNSGAKVQAMLEAAGYTVVAKVILPDEQSGIEQKMKDYADRGVGLVVTTGGTGFSMRDVTPEATLAVCERLAPGIPEAMRALSLKVTDRAMLSRAQAGIHKRTLIVNLPGSVRAVAECLSFVLPTLQHGIEIMRGDASECGIHYAHKD